MVVCVECLPADKPWDCGLCDTPELWRGAAVLRARLYARVLVPLNVYIHAYRYRPLSQNQLLNKVEGAGQPNCIPY